MPAGLRVPHFEGAVHRPKVTLFLVLTQPRGILSLQLQDLVDPASIPQECRQFLPRDFGPSVLHVPFQCNHFQQERPNDVMTAWTLGPADKAEVLGRFLVELFLWDVRREARDLGHVAK